MPRKAVTVEQNTGADKFVALRITEEEINALIFLIPRTKVEGKRMVAQTPTGRVALKILAAYICGPGTCMICECTEVDCRGCIERTGSPCSWVNEGRTLCSACLEDL